MDRSQDRWFDRSWVMWAVVAVLAVFVSVTAVEMTRWVTADRSVVAPSASSSAGPSPSPSLTDEQQIVAQYERYLIAIRNVHLTAADQRRALLEPLVDEPYLSTILEEETDAEGSGLTVWGEPSTVLEILSPQTTQTDQAVTVTSYRAQLVAHFNDGTPTTVTHKKG